MKTMKRWSQDHSWAPEPSETSLDDVMGHEEWLALCLERSRQLGEPHGTLCDCFTCISVRVAWKMGPVRIDSWEDLIGVRWLP